MLTIDELQSWTPDEVTRRLSASKDEAAEIIRVAAEAGIADAQALFGQILLDGHGVERDEGEALRWFSRAAQADHLMAMNMVARCCEHGWGTRADKALAAQWYEAAASRGLDWGMYNLATLYCLGEGVQMDREKAYALFKDAADRGHAKSVNMLGGFHEDGWVVEKDLTAAADLYRRAAEGGDFRGEFNHARMLIDAGELESAIFWLRQVPKTATPAFLHKTANWLSERGEPQLRELADELLAQSHTA